MLIFFSKENIVNLLASQVMLCMKCKCEIYLKVRENHAYTNIRQEETQIPTYLH